MGYSTDTYIRWISSSGGMVTSILLFLLKKGFIDGALVTKMDGLAPISFIAKKPEDVVLAAGSKYLPIKLNIKLLTNLAKFRGKYAIVGLPCHIRAVKNLMANSRELQEHIVLFLGLFCNRTISSAGFRVLLRKMHVNEEEVKEFRFRGCGWPGNISIILYDGRKISLPYFNYWRPLYSPYFFMPRACMFCSDMTNEEADLSFGDAWLPKIMRKDNLGSSIIISRTEEAEKTLQEVQRGGFIKLTDISVKEVIKAQWRPLFFKKITMPARIMLVKRKNYQSNSMGFFKTACALLQIANIKFSESPLGKRVIEKLPLKLLMIYSTFYAMIEYFSWRYVAK